MKRTTCCLAVILLLAVMVEDVSTRSAAQQRREGGRSRAQDSRQQGGRGLVGRAEAITGDRFPIEMETPSGVRVFAVAQPAPAMLRAIDNGFADLLLVARRNGYRARVRASDYTIFIARADRTRGGRGNYSPDIRVAAGGYENTEYDQGGYVYAAGMVLTLEPCSFIVAEHTRDWNRVREVVRFEGEHLVLYHNDRQRYNETVDHSRAGGHPILK